jgi:hypothetical protein
MLEEADGHPFDDEPNCHVEQSDKQDADLIRFSAPRKEQGQALRQAGDDKEDRGEGAREGSMVVLVPGSGRRDTPGEAIQHPLEHDIHEAA